MKNKPKIAKSVKVGTETIRTDAETDELIRQAVIATGGKEKTKLLLDAIKRGLPQVVEDVLKEQEKLRQDWQSKQRGNA